MLNGKDILETITMIQDENLDVRTITMGISLLDCCDSDVDSMCRKVYDKITRCAKNLVRTGEEIEKELGIPIVNKRIAVTPIAIAAEACETEDFVPFAEAMERQRRGCFSFYHGMDLEEVAEELVNDCYDLPEFALRYFDFKAFARDLSFDGYTETKYGVIFDN